MVAGEPVAQRVFVAAEESPHETRVRAVPHFGLREDGILRCERDVGEKRQPRAGAHGPTVDRANDWFAELPHAAEVARIDTPRVDDLGGGLSGNDAVGPVNIPTAAHAISLVHSRG